MEQTTQEEVSRNFISVLSELKTQRDKLDSLVKTVDSIESDLNQIKEEICNTPCINTEETKPDTYIK